MSIIGMQKDTKRNKTFLELVSQDDWSEKSEFSAENYAPMKGMFC